MWRGTKNRDWADYDELRSGYEHTLAVLMNFSGCTDVSFK